MSTVKTFVIERLFKERWNDSAKELTSSLVTLEEVSKAIAEQNSSGTTTPMSTRNPANFFKDFIRKRRSANSNWPKFVLDKGFTARQVTGQSICFEFIRIPDGQIEPFPKADFSNPSPETPVHKIESVSLPLASRRLGRNDEPWLIQVVTRLRIVETHFSVYSKRKVKQVDLLQTSVKLHKTEIDALFLMVEEDEDGNDQEVIVTCEAKRGSDDILEDQILQQAKAPFRMKQIDQQVVVPVAVKCLGPSRIYVVEFDEVTRDEVAEIENVTVASDSIYEIVPPVPGICS